jgi:acylphosphatase
LEDSEKMKAIQIIVTGRVQGVYFRKFTQKQAVKLGITGFVKNISDGNVEIVACAEQEKLDGFVAWCRKGPLLAKVKEVFVSEYSAFEESQQFEIR